MVQKTKKLKKKQPVRRKRRTKKTRRSMLWKSVFYAFLCVFAIVFGYVFYCALTLPDIESAFEKTRQPSTTIVAENGNEIQTFGHSFSSVI